MPPELWAALQATPQLQADLVDVLLQAHWPDSYHDSIRSALGLEELRPGEVQTSIRRKRDPAFRDQVLRAYRRPRTGVTRVCTSDCRRTQRELAPACCS